MKSAVMAAVLGWGLLASAQAQDRVYRCPGNAYTNNAAEARTKGCKQLDGSGVTVIQGGRAPAAGGGGESAPARAQPTRTSTSTSATPTPSRIDTPEQRARDSDARAILESELKKAEARQAQLQTEYNNGQPERRGDERNYQKYLDRVTDLRAQLGRAEADIASLKRELARVGGASAPR